MSICIKTENGGIFDIEGTEASIGSDESCAIAFPGDERVAFQHAKLTKIYFQWRIDTLDGTQISINDRNMGTGAFLQSNDCIALSPTGPVITFRPTEPQPPTEAAEDNLEAESAEAPEAVPESSVTTDVELDAEDAAQVHVATVNAEQADAEFATALSTDSEPVATAIVDPERVNPAPASPAHVDLESAETSPNQQGIDAAPPIAQVVSAPSSATVLAAQPISPVVAVANTPVATDQPWECAEDSPPRPRRRDSASPVSMMISAALGGLTVFGLYKLMALFGFIN